MTDSVPLLATISESESPSANESRIRSTKVLMLIQAVNREPPLTFCFQRKLDDAFHVLDNAVNHNEKGFEESERPPPPKRSNTIRSLYSTLAKYGIKSREGTPS